MGNVPRARFTCCSLPLPSQIAERLVSLGVAPHLSPSGRRRNKSVVVTMPFRGAPTGAERVIFPH